MGKIGEHHEAKINFVIKAATLQTTGSSTRILGYNYRISDINCALGIEQLKRIDTILARREAMARTYTQILGEDGGLTLPPLSLPGRRISWFVYVVRLGKRFDQLHCDWVVREMLLRGIALGRYFAPIHLQPIYRSFSTIKTLLPVTEFHASRSFALPFFNRIRDEQISEVCRTLVNLIRSLKLGDS
ncbi:MAG: DegT/DnrJ/EryC1/StrS family aminotransferase [Candidatus Acidiferrales bacterium]